MRKRREVGEEMICRRGERWWRKERWERKGGKGEKRGAEERREVGRECKRKGETNRLCSCMTDVFDVHQQRPVDRV